MGTQPDDEDEAAFNRRVGHANIESLGVAKAALFVGVIALPIAILQLPWVQQWINNQHLDLQGFISSAKDWLSTPWTLPWTAWIVIVAVAYGLGLLSVLVARSGRAREWLFRVLEPIALSFNPHMGRNENLSPKRPLTCEEEDEITVAELATPLPTLPTLEDMDKEQLLVLCQMGRRVRNVNAAHIAEFLNQPEVVVIAALQQLQKWGLVTSGVLHWRLTDSGVEYVNEHRAILLG